MCGIAGSARVTDSIGVLRNVEPMVELLQHRGPDQVASYNSEHFVGGIARLSIVDIRGGAQPFLSEDNRYVTFFNGEIYNAPALRRWLMSRGHSFTTATADGEVLPHLYEEHGVDYANHLEGMFAIAIWDRELRVLTLTRDPHGVKPLYFTFAGGVASFASEIKALVDQGGAELAPHKVDEYHRWGFVPGSSTVFSNISSVGRAETVVISRHGVKRASYWTPQPTEDFANPSEAALAVRAELERSVNAQLAADVDVGLFLSGGIDSSAVAALARQYSRQTLSSFSLVFPGMEAEGKTRDRNLARLIAQKFELDHHEVPLDMEIFISGLMGVVAAFDQPFAGVSSTYFLSMSVAKHVKVCLTGDGADELFGSYLFHRASAYRDFADAGCSPAPRAFGLSERDAAITLKSRDPIELRRSLSSRYLPNTNELYSDEFREWLRDSGGGEDVSTSRSSREYGIFPSGTWLSSALAIDQDIQLVDEVLAFSDRLSMAHSLELRPPFLTKHMSNISRSIPFQWQISPEGVKNILRMAMRDILPDAVLDREKEGFVPPVKNWMALGLEKHALEVLEIDRIAQHGLWNPRGVATLLDGLIDSPTSYFRKVWTLVMFQLWWEYCRDSLNLPMCRPT